MQSQRRGPDRPTEELRSTELQVYRRTLFGRGMQLHFTRSSDGGQVRHATGQRVTVAE